MRIAIKFAYDGRKFQGYARQPNLKTVEGELIKVLIKNGYIVDIKESFFRSASRTDKNVSAICNVVAFNTLISKAQIIDRLSNDITDIITYGIAEVESDFNPRYAKHRQYRYYLPSSNLNIEKIVTTSSFFTGKHNFSNFARLESFKDPIRTIDNIVFNFENDFLIIDFYAQTFLWHQIRRIISALEKVGSGKLEKEQIIEALNYPEKKIDFGLAPAHFLFLKNIVYDIDFLYENSKLMTLKNFENHILSSIIQQ